MNRWIITPNILEINTNHPVLRGFSINRFNNDYNNFLLKFATHSRNRYEYIVGKVNIPDNPEAIYHYYSLKEGKVYYSRNIGPLSLSFSYEIDKKVMITNHSASKIPFEFGHIWPPALHLSDIICLDLLIKDGLLLMAGTAVKIENKTYCIMAPSMTGKTTLMSYLINKKNAKYIAEDTFLTDGNNVFLVPPFKYEPYNLKMLKDATIISSSIDSLLFLAKSKKFLTEDIDTLLNIYSRTKFHYDDDEFVKALQFFGLYNLKFINTKKNMVLNSLMKKDKKLITFDHKRDISNTIQEIFSDFNDF